jgi:hypothetical protein
MFLQFVFLWILSWSGGKSMQLFLDILDTGLHDLQTWACCTNPSMDFFGTCLGLPLSIYFPTPSSKI